MNHEQLVENLADDLKPVQVVKSFSLKAMVFQGLILLLLALIMLALKKNPVNSHFESPWYLLEITFAVFMSGILLWGAMKLSIPGRKQVRWIKPLTIILSLSLLVSMVAHSVQEQISFHQHGDYWICVVPSLAFSVLVAGIYTFFITKNLAPTNPREIGAMAMAAASVLVGAFTSVYCLASGPLHQILWHYGPVAFLSFFGFFLGRKILRW